jgi:hypothetical protein
MAHECPTCYYVCHCGGDIDDIQMDGTTEQMNCSHCADEWGDDDEDYTFFDDEDDDEAAVTDQCGQCGYTNVVSAGQCGNCGKSLLSGWRS